MRYDYSLKMVTPPNASKDAEKVYLSYIADWDVK
jgi:hypothetical protein